MNPGAFVIFVCRVRSCSPMTLQTLGNLTVQETSVANYFNTDERRSDLEGESDDELTYITSR